MSEDLPETSQDMEQLHAAMTQATAHIGAIRADPARLVRAQRRHRLSEGGVVAGVLSVALVAATIAVHAGGGAATTPAGPATTSQASTTGSPAPSKAVALITPVAASVYDSDNGGEGSGTLNRLLNGSGAWETNQYCGRQATFAGLPKSTGVVFDLGAVTRLGSVTVSIGTPGADLEVWAADPSVAVPPAIRPGQPPAGFAKVAGSAADASQTRNVFTLSGVRTEYVLVWFTGVLPAVPNPDSAIHCAHDDGQRYGDTITAVQFARG